MQQINRKEQARCREMDTNPFFRSQEMLGAEREKAELDAKAAAL